MMKYRPLLVAAGFAITSCAMASEELASANNCLACHKTDSKLVGPSYQEIAAKYKGQADAADVLYDSVKNGAMGKWGQIPMPPNAGVSDEDIKTLVDWILAM